MPADTLHRLHGGTILGGPILAVVAGTASHSPTLYAAAAVGALATPFIVGYLRARADRAIALEVERLRADHDARVRDLEAEVERYRQVLGVLRHD